MAWSILVSDWLARAAVGGLIVLTLGGIAVRLCRQPARRARLVVFVLLGGLTAPWLGAVPGVPRWRVGAWTSTRAEASPMGETPVPARLPGYAEARPPGVTAKVSGTLLTAAEREGRGGPVPGARGRFAAFPFSFSWRVAIAVAYAAGSGGLAAWWLLGQALLWRLARAARPAPPTVRDRFLAVSGPAGERVRLLESDRIALPFTFTWTRPVILLPGSLCRGAEPRELRFCLAHEWSHVERGDARAWSFATLAGLLLFYQPLYWWLRRELRLCQDYLADDNAAALDSAEDYAAFLVRLARQDARASALPALGVGDRKTNLYRRILMLINERDPLERRCRMTWTLAAAAAAAVVTLAASALRLDAADSKERAGDTKAAATPREGRAYACRVVDKRTGEPIAGASVLVRLSLFTDPKTGGTTPLQETRQTTDERGNYRLAITSEQAAAPSLYVYIDVEHPGYVKEYGGYGYGMIVKNEKLGDRPFFETVRLRPGKAIEARLVDPAGKPVAGVQVNAFGREPAAKNEGHDFGTFTWTTSDADGRFRLDLFPAGPAVFWICPRDFALSTHVLKDDRRGDLGTIALEAGNAIRGRLLDAQGKPVAGAYVGASRDRTKELAEVAELNFVGDQVSRSVVTAADGSFTIPALPAGSYTVDPDEQGHDPATRRDVEDRPRKALPGVFTARKVSLVDGEAPEPLTIRGIPHVVVEARIVNSKGEKARGHEAFLSGMLDGEHWSTRVPPDADGVYHFLAPHGLEDAQIDPSTNEHTVLRHRASKDAPLSEDRTIRLGTLDHDVKGVEIVHYVAPVLVVKVATKEGTTPAGAAVSARYTVAKKKGRRVLKGGVRSDCGFEEQNDGRFRSSQLFPDVEVTVTAQARGYAPKSATVSLPEGSNRDVALVLDQD